MINGLVRCVHPGIDNHVSFGTVLNVDYDAGLMQSYMDVEDLEGRVLNAITEYTCDLTVPSNYANQLSNGKRRPVSRHVLYFRAGGREITCPGCTVVENTKSKTEAATKAACKAPVRHGSLQTSRQKGK